MLIAMISHSFWDTNKGSGPRFYDSSRSLKIIITLQGRQLIAWQTGQGKHWTSGSQQAHPTQSRVRQWKDCLSALSATAKSLASHASWSLGVSRARSSLGVIVPRQSDAGQDGPPPLRAHSCRQVRQNECAHSRSTAPAPASTTSMHTAHSNDDVLLTKGFCSNCISSSSASPGMMNGEK